MGKAVRTLCDPDGLLRDIPKIDRDFCDTPDYIEF